MARNSRQTLFGDARARFGDAPALFGDARQSLASLGRGLRDRLGALFSLFSLFSGPSGNAAARHRATMELTFAGMGRISKSSGRVLVHHIDLVEGLMESLNFTPALRRQAIAWFQAGKAPSFPFLELASACRRESAAQPVLRDFTLECLVRCCLIQETANAGSSLATLSALLGCTDKDIHRIREKLLNPGTDDKSDSQALRRAYEVLAVSAESTTAEIKLAYRRLVSKHHPDRLMREANADEIALAQRRVAEFREALEAIEARREERRVGPP